jgi:DNA-binding NtrC family response regulator
MGRVVPAAILYLDADPAAPSAVRTLAALAHRVHHAVDLSGFEREMAGGCIDVAVVDTSVIGTGWLAWLAEAGRRWPDLPVVLLSSGGGEEDSIAAVRAGAATFLRKPFDPVELLMAVQNGVSTAEHSAAAPPPTGIERTVEAAGPAMVGTSQAMREVNNAVRLAAASKATVLVRGESGSGKEVIARRIHALSPRAAGPFVKVHCAALPEALLESELFGHEKGAFTGATSRKPGRVEIAEGGTLFLDEIGDISAAIQVKLLRVLQDKEYERVGGTRPIKADVRFVAATHRPLEDMIRKGTFREDLYYRLNVVSIVAPPLRARPDDIDSLARHFCQILGAQNGKPGLRLSPEAIQILRRQPWPGNVRQLQNFVERLVVFAESDEIGPAPVLAELAAGSRAQPETKGAELDFTISVLELDEVVRRAERKALEKALQKAGGNRTVAARILGVSRRTLYNKLEEHGLLT